MIRARLFIESGPFISLTLKPIGKAQAEVVENGRRYHGPQPGQYIDFRTGLRLQNADGEYRYFGLMTPAQRAEFAEYL